MQCVICNSKRLTHAMDCKGYRLFRCLDCSHIFVVDGASSDIDYDAAYYAAPDKSSENATGYTDYLGNLERRIAGFRARIKQIETVTGRRGKLLDYGCAVGACVKAAKDAGWDAVGYERSAWAADWGRRELGVEIVDGDVLGEAFAPKSFDVVTLWDVIEHVDKPREIFEFVTRVLKPGGLIAMNTVNASSLGARLANKRWRHLAPPYHLNYFTRASLTRLVADAGFEIVRSDLNGVLFEAANRSPTMTRLLAPLEYVATHWRLRPMAKALNLLDEIEIMAVLHRGA